VSSEAPGDAAGAMKWRPPAPYRPLSRRAKRAVTFLLFGVITSLVALRSDFAERSFLNDAAAGKLITAAEADAVPSPAYGNGLLAR
jgi:hypothetical protein